MPTRTKNEPLTKIENQELTWKPFRIPFIPSAGGGRQEILNVVKFIIRTRTSVGGEVGAANIASMISLIKEFSDFSAGLRSDEIL